VLAEFDIVDVRGAAELEDRAELVLGAIKRSHPRRSFGPNTNIKEAEAGPFSGRNQRIDNRQSIQT
jgi:hypothetical protein